VRQLSGVRKRKKEKAQEAGAAVVDDSLSVLLAPHQVSLSLWRLQEKLFYLFWGHVLSWYLFVLSLCLFLPSRLSLE
jgi:hypothetical protein